MKSLYTERIERIQEYTITVSPEEYHHILNCIGMISGSRYHDYYPGATQDAHHAAAQLQAIYDTLHKALQS